MCVCVFVCVISNQSTSKKSHCVSDLSSKLDALLHKTQTKVFLVLRLNMCRSILSLSKIAHQMGCDQPFRQRNMATERTGEMGVRGDGEVGDKILKNGGSNIGDLNKIRGLATLCQLCKKRF